MTNFGKTFEILRNNAVGTTIITFQFSQQFQRIMISATADVYVSFNKDAGDTGGTWGSSQGNVYRITATGTRQGESFEFLGGQITNVQVQAVTGTSDVSIIGITP